MVAWAVEPENENPAVLITDDNDAWRAIVQDILRDVGLRTLQATCGEEAIELVRTAHLDLVLIDFHMPRLDGIETLRIIRRHDERVPAVLMTADPEHLPTVDVRALRIESVLAKSADRRHIVTTVTKIIRWNSTDYQ